MDWLQRRKYAVLLVALLTLFVGYPLTKAFLAAILLYNLLFTAVFFVGLLAVAKTGPRRWLMLLLGLPSLVFNWIAQFQPGLPQLPAAMVFHGCAIAFLGLLVILVLDSVYHQQRITLDSILGAFCGYFLLGIAFAHLYCLVQIAAPNSFDGAPGIMVAMTIADERFFLLSYFSLVTLTTVGYGEIWPATELTRSLAAIEAILGQFFVAVLVADLIGKKLTARVESDGK
jgi:voltage-gated potassium channel